MAGWTKVRADVVVLPSGSYGCESTSHSGQLARSRQAANTAAAETSTAQHSQQYESLRSDAEQRSGTDPAMPLTKGVDDLTKSVRSSAEILVSAGHAEVKEFANNLKGRCAGKQPADDLY